jgi:hypothetical protein
MLKEVHISILKIECVVMVHSVITFLHGDVSSEDESEELYGVAG